MIWLISDIHGCFFTLQELLKKIRSDDSNAQLVFVGDYVDRGIHSSKVVDLIIQEQKNGAYCLRGNHDDVIDWILNGSCKSDLTEMLSGEIDLERVGWWWMANGLNPTLTSYGLNSSSWVNLEKELKKFNNIVPDAHKEFFRGLDLYWSNDTHFACHAYFTPYYEPPSDSVLFERMDVVMNSLWTRFPRKSKGWNPVGIDVDAIWSKIGVFGHTPVSYYGEVAPIRHGKIRMIDTCAFSGKSLTAYCCDNDDWISQNTDSRDLES